MEGRGGRHVKLGLFLPLAGDPAAMAEYLETNGIIP